MEVTAALAGTTAFPIPQGATTADPVPFMQQQANERPAAAAAAAEQERQRQQRHEPQGVKGWAQRESSPQQGQPTQQQSPQQQSPQQRQQEQQEQGEGDELQQESEETEKPRPQRPKGPPSEEERQRVREKYRERLRERKLQIYQRALQEVIHREKEDAQTRLLFKIHLPTRFGENLYVLGNDACLGSWCMDRAIPMQWTDGNVWSLSLALPNGVRRLEYKYVIKEGLRITWEPGQNHIWGPRNPAATKGVLGASGPISVFDSWGGGTG